jgi:antitoxin component YwqK of YwqJK toxin-antitoxin module
MYVKYFEDGLSIHVRGELVNGKQEGLWEEYYEFPYFMKSMNRFKDGFFHGMQMSWHPNGHLHSMIEYEDGHLHGETKLYDTNRTLVYHAIYEKGSLIKVKVEVQGEQSD